MALETTLVNCPWIIIAKSLVLSELAEREKLMFMGKNFLVSRTQIAHDLMMHTFDVSMKIGPSQASNIATGIGAIVS